MSQKEIEALIKLAEDKIKHGVSRQEAMETFVDAGILNKEGHFTDNYKTLEAIIELKK